MTCVRCGGPVWFSWARRQWHDVRSRDDIAPSRCRDCLEDVTEEVEEAARKGYLAAMFYLMTNKEE